MTHKYYQQNEMSQEKQQMIFTTQQQLCQDLIMIESTFYNVINVL